MEKKKNKNKKRYISKTELIIKKIGNQKGGYENTEEFEKLIKQKKYTSFKKFYGAI